VASPPGTLQRAHILLTETNRRRSQSCHTLTIQRVMPEGNRAASAATTLHIDGRRRMQADVMPPLQLAPPSLETPARLDGT